MSSSDSIREFDWFKLVADYIGFAPSRFYLRETCKAISKSIPKRVVVSSENFRIALQHKLVNPDNLILEPVVDSDAINNVLDACADLENIDLEMKILRQTFMCWDSETVAELASMNYLEMLEWDTWLAKAYDISEKVVECKRLKDPTQRRQGLHALYQQRPTPGVRPDLNFVKRFISEWHRPTDEAEWRTLFNTLIRRDIDTETTEYISKESGLDPVDLSDALEFFSKFGNVELTTRLLAEERDHSDNEVHRALWFAVEGRHYEIIRLLVDRFGLIPNICVTLMERQDIDPPDVEFIDFLISRGANLNGTPGLQPTTSVLDLAYRNGYWELAEAIIERGGELHDLGVVLGGLAGSNIEYFRIHLLNKGRLEGRINASLVISAMDRCNSAEVILEIFNLVYAVDPSIVPRLFTESMERLCYRWPVLVPLMKELIRIDQSLVGQPLSAGIFPIGVCALRRLLGEPTEYETWTEFFFSRYFHNPRDPREVQDLDHMPDWLLSREALSAIVDLEKTLIEFGADPQVWFKKVV